MQQKRRSERFTSGVFLISTDSTSYILPAPNLVVLMPSKCRESQTKRSTHFFLSWGYSFWMVPRRVSALGLDVVVEVELESVAG